MDSMGFMELENIWYYFLALEQDLSNTSRYIEPYKQDETHSFEFYKIILLSRCEIEAVFKLLHYKLTGKAGRDISDYKRALLSNFPNLGKALVIVPRWRAKNLYPFSGWGKGKLAWWDTYQRIKHNRIDQFEKATYSMAVNSMAALYILILCLYETYGFECKADDSNYFESDYYHHPLYGKDYQRILDVIN